MRNMMVVATPIKPMVVVEKVIKAVVPSKTEEEDQMSKDFALDGIQKNQAIMDDNKFFHLQEQEANDQVFKL